MLVWTRTTDATTARTRYATATTRAIGCTTAPSEDLLTRGALSQGLRATLVVDLRAVAYGLLRPLRDEIAAYVAHALLEEEVVRLPGDDLASEVALRVVARGDLAKDGSDLLAHLATVGASRVERAARRHLDRRRKVAAS